MADQKRRQSGTPQGGQWAPDRKAEAGGTDVLDDSGEQLCATCGKKTKRTSGLCRKHDPARKKRKKRRKKSPVKGVGHVSDSGPIYNKEAGSVPEEEIVRCDFEFVPKYRGGQRIEGQTRPCKNAVRKPGTTCHKHGGTTGTSLGRTVAKARAEAGRGECWPLAVEHWDQADERLAALEGELLEMLDSDISSMAKMYNEYLTQATTDGTGRFSPMNQLLLLVQHASEARRDGHDGEDVWSEAAARTAEPHMTKEAWERAGRHVDEDTAGVVVQWWQPGRKVAPEQHADEPDDEYKKRVEEETTFYRGSHGAHVQYRLSETSGDDYEVVSDPLSQYVPDGHGDADAAAATMRTHAEDMGITVRHVARKPAHGYAYWSASDNEIVVWDGIAEGNPKAVAHSMAHELGHAMLGHSTNDDGQIHSAEKEVAAEAFAALTTAHHGIDSSEVAAWYVDNWAKGGHRVDMKQGGLSALRDAVKTFDAYRTAIS